MNEWFFTADTHFDHSNVIKYNRRPYNSIDEHNEALISNWNEIVKNGAHVVICGDFTLHTNAELVKRKFIDRLNGNKIFIKGNHDYWLRKDKRHIYHKKIGKHFIVACHYPLLSWAKKNHGSWHFHGHVHTNGTNKFEWLNGGKWEEIVNLLNLNKMINVGVDFHNYYPVNLDELTR